MQSLRSGRNVEVAGQAAQRLSDDELYWHWRDTGAELRRRGLLTSRQKVDWEKTVVTLCINLVIGLIGAALIMAIFFAVVVIQ
jgi:hypothetical protein